MSKKSDFKEQVKAPDAFVSTSARLLEFAERHVRTVILVAGVALLGGAGYVGFDFWKDSAETSAAEAIYKHEAELSKAEDKFRAPPEGVGAKPPTPDYAKDFAPLVDKVKAEIKAKGSTRAALVSALKLASFLQQQKQYALALEVLDLTSYKPPTTELLGGLWRMQRGLLLLENQKTADAVKVYDEVLKAKSLKLLHAESMLKKALALDVSGEAERARSIYEQLGREHPNTEASASAAQYLRLMELKPAGPG